MSDEPSFELKPWRDRSNTIGILPGRGTEQIDALRLVVRQLPLPVTGHVKMVSAEGAPKTVSCDSLFGKQLSRSALVIRGANRNGLRPMRYRIGINLGITPSSRATSTPTSSFSASYSRR